MQRIITFIALLAAATTMSGRTIDENGACRIAERFLQAKGISTTLKATYLENQSQSRGGDNEAPYHIFNLSEGGFIIIAGDDRAKPVLAYSLEGNFDSSSIPEPCHQWLNQYAAEINSAAGTSLATAATETEYPKEIIAPLIKTTWSQEAPFNNSCPTDASSGKKCLTGCLATASAQIMNFHQYPLRGTGTITYTDPKQKVERMMDFTSRGDFNWTNITGRYPFPVSTQECDAVAELMLQVGHAMKMQYSPSTSIAYLNDAAFALIKTFNYSPNIHRYERAYIHADEWMKLLVAELSANRPILYDGRSTQSGGHAFVCDGYDGNGMFHFNWGWGGMSNGYFVLSALTPTSGDGIQDYTGEQVAECGIMPADAAGSVPQTKHLAGIYSLNVFTSKTEVYSDENTYIGKADKSGFIFYCLNLGHYKFKGEIYATINVGGEIIPVSSKWSGEITAGNNTPVTLYIPSSLADGTYTVSFHYRLEGDDNWYPMKSRYSTPYQAAVKVSGDDVTFGKDALSSIVTIENDTPIELAIGQGSIEISSESGLGQVILCDISGRTVVNLNHCGNSASIDTSTLSHGTYILQAISNNNSRITRKIIL